MIRLPSVLMGRLWLGFWMGPGQQKEETMVRSLEFSALSPNLQGRMGGWKWREEWTTSPVRKPPPRSHGTASLSSWVEEQSRVPNRAAPQLTGTEAPALRNLPNLTLYILSTGALSTDFTTTFNKLVNSSVSLSSVSQSSKLIKLQEGVMGISDS